MEIYESFDDFLFEFDKKDIKRIESMLSKARGNEAKLISYAQTMAKLIKDPVKAVGRAEAAENIMGKDNNEVAAIFWAKAKELGADVGNFKSKPKGLQIGSRMKGGKKAGREATTGNRSRWFKYGSPILPIGKVNLNTGKSKYFNVYDTWPDSTAEVLEIDRDWETICFCFLL